MSDHVSRRFLDDQSIAYSVILHPPRWSSRAIAAVAHVCGADMVKPVMVKIEDRLGMAIIAADRRVDLDRLRAALGARSVDLADEWEFKDRFPDCETGAMPPFGHLYSIPVYADVSLRERRGVAFSAGAHHETIRLRGEDFLRLVRARWICGLAC
jgi:Ala-tRNA(Pro) deacylase